MNNKFKPGTLVKLKDDAFDPEELSVSYNCFNTEGVHAALARKILCGQLAEIINVYDIDCYKAWLPILKVFIVCYKTRFQKLK